jgi:DNA replication and repair protein RecF
MQVNWLSLVNFRNFESEKIIFNPHLNIILGENGQGKTNIIEAIYLLTEGESFRYAKNENLIRLHTASTDSNEPTLFPTEMNFAFIRSEIKDRDLSYKAAMRISNSKKELQVNDKPTTHSKLKNFSSVLFSPESLNIIKESSEERRALADQLVKQTTQNGGVVIQEFKKVLKTRNRLLKDLLEQKINIQIGRDTLESLNISYLKLAAELTFLRLCVLNEIKPEVEKQLHHIHNSSINQGFKNFDFKYMISELDHKSSNLEKIIFFMKKRMQELELAELKSGVSLVGPHKHDISFVYNGNDSRFYCSQGQQRSIILAYKMAQIVYHHKVHGFYPLLLLDDVLSELDLSKQESLISTLNQTETQTFVSTTDVSLLSKLSMNNANVFNIRNGQIVE